ncbi:XRE family transcriptional regulator [Pontibacter diazotrophicus]|uniref:XRE family transcriptional regulator n=1 Tax=Pontibacter diazotrophicus TaxID=1400979 RepID=A0A3D8L8T6_9BACT|nr:helix-turn-helix domain-containing protein [Pontibacter diazotrophicus]RDV13819.1 XRE family transcriptional regulator [Pontibacter diazotrophicus]
MNEIGTKIREIRKKKGLAQEELAEASKVNLRTIQRIEKNESEPRGKTLNLICEALGISAEDILDYGKQEDKSYLMLLHLSVISFIAIPIGNIVLPLILWLTKKEKIVGLKETGANILNFQIVWTFFTFLSATAYALSKILHFPFMDVMLYVFMSLCALNIVLPVVFALKQNKGESLKMYPSIIRFIK